MRSHFGCRTCKQRKVKCDEERPVCGPCARSSRKCVFSSSAVFRHYGIDDVHDTGRDLERQPRSTSHGWRLFAKDQAWIEVPSHLTFVHILDPFAEDEGVPFDGLTPPTAPVSGITADGHGGVAPPSFSGVRIRCGSSAPDDGNVLVAQLLQHFKESPSQWMDSFASSAYFSTKVSLLAATRPLLMASVSSLAAKHLHRLCHESTSLPTSKLPYLTKSRLQWTQGNIDWKHQSMRFYDQAIHYLKEATLSQPGDGESMTSPSRREEMFAAVVILCTCELLDAPISGYKAHFNALPLLYSELSNGASPGSLYPEPLLHIPWLVFWSLARQDCLSAFINETQTRLDLGHLELWRNFGLAIDSYGQLLPTTSATSLEMDPTWFEEDMLSNTLIWIVGKIINFITSGDGLNPGDFESPPGQRSWLGVTQEDLLERWKNIELELFNWCHSLPPTFTPCARQQLALSDVVAGTSIYPERTVDAILFTIPMCAITMQTYHMARILLLMNRPQESTAIRSTLTARLKSYREISVEVLQHAREICGISIAGLPDAIRPHSVQAVFVAGQCFEHPGERQLVVDLLRAVERDLGWPTDYRVQDLVRQWAED